MKNPSTYDMQQVDRILHYVISTPDLGLNFSGQGGVTLNVFVDASFAIHDDRKSHYGTCMFIGENSASFATKSRKAKSVTVSSTEAEYMALSEAAKAIMWARQLLDELGYKQEEPTVVYEDNKSTINMVNKGNDKGRTKHIDVRFHYIRELVETNQIVVEYKPTEEMIADMVTKALGKPLYLKFQKKILGIQEYVTKAKSIESKLKCAAMAFKSIFKGQSHQGGVSAGASGCCDANP